MLRFLPTVRIVRFYAPLGVMLDIASDWSALARVDVDVNSIDDGAHHAGTLHGRSLAVDFDTALDRAADLEDLYQHLRVQLPAGYDVIHEGDHVHVEWDAHRPVSRLSLPPAPPTI